MCMCDRPTDPERNGVTLTYLPIGHRFHLSDPCSRISPLPPTTSHPPSLPLLYSPSPFPLSPFFSSAKMDMSTPTPHLQRPIPRRPFDLPTDDLSLSPTDDAPPTRTRSTVSLTASTLFGIYSHTLDDTTPLITRNNSSTNLTLPASPPPPHPRQQRQEPAVNVLARVLCLFLFGLTYGAMVTRLHARSAVLVTVDVGVWWWGGAAVVAGCVLPLVDGEEEGRGGGKGGWEWSYAVALRSAGAFAGIAYAIRRLPWQSPLQVSLALAAVNPFLWFLVDRTRGGFLFASVVGVVGSVVVGLVEGEGGGTERIACAVWVGSVLFCSCVCFGNVGRKLAGWGKE
ncbi:hypothetical protein K440DRAFT_49100 [Wilcoxina mikolae CBS 423.85]|nr:hypothetical protein K440DRAFT_49100 [Wilcoxina mikolae CBS 423.85]